MTKAASGPGYREVADRLRERIKGGEFRPGDKLPTIPELQKTYDASANVIRDAIRQLARDRMVESRQGVGSTVQNPDEWLTSEADAIMQRLAALQGEVRALSDRVAAIERRRRPPGA